MATSNSWGGGGNSTALFEAIKEAGTEDVLFIAAAGNSNSNNDATAAFPANYGGTGPYKLANVISVGSVTSTGLRSSFSSYGSETVHLFAPGSSILSTYPGGAGRYTSSVATLSGTQQQRLDDVCRL